MKTAFCFDLDGTITRQEILPLIAQNVGLQDEFEALTTATINGILPFSSSLKLRCRLLAEVPISQAKSLISHIELFEEVVAFIKQNKQSCFIVTGNLDVWVEDIVDEIGCYAYSSKATYNMDKLTGIAEILDKGEAIKNIRAKGFERIVAVGDGMGDIDMFKESDVSIAYSAVHQPSRALQDVCDIVIYDEFTLCKKLASLL